MLTFPQVLQYIITYGFCLIHNMNLPPARAQRKYNKRALHRNTPGGRVYSNFLRIDLVDIRDPEPKNLEGP